MALERIKNSVLQTHGILAHLKRGKCSSHPCCKEGGIFRTIVNSSVLISCDVALMYKPTPEIASAIMVKTGPVLINDGLYEGNGLVNVMITISLNCYGVII